MTLLPNVSVSRAKNFKKWRNLGAKMVSPLILILFKNYIWSNIIFFMCLCTIIINWPTLASFSAAIFEYVLYCTGIQVCAFTTNVSVRIFILFISPLHFHLFISMYTRCNQINDSIKERYLARSLDAQAILHLHCLNDTNFLTFNHLKRTV